MSDQHTDPAGPDTEQAGSVDARFTKIEAEQAEQGGKLDQILARLPGTGNPADKPAAAPAADDPATIAEQVRRAVEAVGAEKEQKDAADAHAADHEALKEMREKPPRETTQGWRGKLQRAMYGGDPK